MCRGAALDDKGKLYRELSVTVSNCTISKVEEGQ